MDARKGIKRLSAFVVGLYFAFWAVMAYMGYRDSDYALAQLKLHPYGDPQNNFWLTYMLNSDWWITQSVHWGFLPAIGLVILSPIIFWVYRGFFPKVQK